MTIEFHLREMLPGDGDALINLLEYDPPVADHMYGTTRFLINPVDAWKSLSPHLIGVVAESPDVDGLVGSATASIIQVQIDGKIYPMARLENLKVHHDFRGNGIGTALARWRIDKARELYGDQVVIVSGTIAMNTASISTMKKWTSQFLEGVTVVPMFMHREPPTLPTGLTIREAHPDEFQAIADASNAFYRDYNLYPVLSPAFITEHVSAIPRAYYYRVAVDGDNRLVAGALISIRSGLMVDQMHNVPPNTPVAMMGGVLKTGEMGLLWFTDSEAGHALWEVARWDFRDQVNSVAAMFDPRGKVGDALQIPPEHPIRLELVTSLAGVDLDLSKPIAPHLRG